MEGDIISSVGKSQGEGFSQSVCGAGNEGKRLRSRHKDKYTRTQVLRVLCELHHGKCYFGGHRCIRKNVTFR